MYVFWYRPKQLRVSIEQTVDNFQLNLIVTSLLDWQRL